MQELRMKPGRLSLHGETEETRSLSEASVLSCVSYENTFSAVISSPYLHLLAGLDRRKRIFIRYGEPQAHGNSVAEGCRGSAMPLSESKRPTPKSTMTLDRVLSRFGLASRAEARSAILAGRLKVNG